MKTWHVAGVAYKDRRKAKRAALKKGLPITASGGPQRHALVRVVQGERGWEWICSCGSLGGHACGYDEQQARFGHTLHLEREAEFGS